MHLLNRYSASPGTPANPPAALSKQASDSVFKASPGKFSVVMVVHPLCQCSRASLDNLQEILMRASGKIQAFVVVNSPDDASAEWTNSDMVRTARQIPGVRVVNDPGAHISARLGAVTSGQVYVFSDHGRLLFSGGITDGRGHVGECEGMTSILSIVRGSGSRMTTTPVYGCALVQSSMTPHRFEH